MPNESMADTPDDGVIAGKELLVRCIGCKETPSPGLLAIDEPEGCPSLVVPDKMIYLSGLKSALVGRPRFTGTWEPMVRRGNGEIDLRLAKGEWVRRRWDHQRRIATRKIRPPAIAPAIAPL
jgi:hypothetical protein